MAEASSGSESLVHYLAFPLPGGVVHIALQGLTDGQARLLAQNFEAELAVAGAIEPSGPTPPLVRVSQVGAEDAELVLLSRHLHTAETIYCGRSSPPVVVTRDGQVTLGSDAGVTQVSAFGFGDERLSIAVETAVLRALATSYGLNMVHALAYEFRGVGTLVLGASGAGKTTLALAALRAGARIVSDDALLVGSDAQGYFARRLRADLFLREGSLAQVRTDWADDLRELATASGPRWVLPAQSLSAATGVYMRVHRLIVLEPHLPPGCGLDVSVRPLPSVSVLVELLKSSNPAFLGGASAGARDALSRMAHNLVANAVGLGEGIVTRPEAVFEDLQLALSAE